jgi:hypothetical protein
MSNSQPAAGRVTVWVGIASSILTIALTLFNASTKGQSDAADLLLKQKRQKFEAKFQERATVVEEFKERTFRYLCPHSLS